MNGNEYMFHTEGLSVGYNGKPLIKDISLYLKKGEILTLIGPNGAGKTTILRSLIRQLPSISGTVYLGKEDMAKIPGKELAKQLSILLTEKVKPELMSCRDMVETGRYPYTGRFGKLSGKDEEIVSNTMKLVQIEELAEQSFDAISDGQRQRVMLARALCQEPELLILDEPTSFLDIHYKLEFLSILQNLSRQRGMTVILSLHELDLANRISDKIACVKGDHVDRFGTPEEVFRGSYLSELYDVTAGSYDTISGIAELQPMQKDPAKVFVLAGGGSGAELFRKLQRAGISFRTGILWKNDLDYPSAKALAEKVLWEDAYSPISPEMIELARKEIEQAEMVYCTLDFSSLGSLAAPLQELSQYAKELGKLV